MTTPASISEIAKSVRTAPPRCGSTRVVAIDGPAGAGKTTFANSLAVELGGTPSAGAGAFDPAAPLATDVRILHADDMYEGWAGLDALEDLLVGEILAPLAADRDASFRMWDWERDARGATVPVPAPEVLIIEGVGAASRAARGFASLVIWVDAPADVRTSRGIARDGEEERHHWEAWQPAEAEHHAREGTRAAADFVVDGTRPLR